MSESEEIGSSDQSKREINIDYLQGRWEEDDEFRELASIESLLRMPGFMAHVVTAIKNTEQSGQIREHGFFGFRDFLVPDNKTHYLSPLYEGDESSINFDKLEEVRDEIEFGEFNVQGPCLSVVFHTHPGEEAQIGSLTPFSRLLYAVTGVYNPDVIQDGFSERDLMTFKQRAQDENTALIFALGTQNRLDSCKGKLLLMNFRNVEGLINLDPINFSMASLLERHKHGDGYLEAYKKAGLNIVQFDLDLTAEKPLSEDDIKLASEILSQRDVTTLESD